MCPPCSASSVLLAVHVPLASTVQGARIGEGSVIEALDVMDLDMLETGKNVTVGEGATIIAHTFKDGYLHFSEVPLTSALCSSDREL